MSLTIVAIALISALVAYANGANDVSKGIATLAAAAFPVIVAQYFGARYGQRAAALRRSGSPAQW